MAGVVSSRSRLYGRLVGAGVHTDAWVAGGVVGRFGRRAGPEQETAESKVLLAVRLVEHGVGAGVELSDGRRDSVLLALL